MEQLEVQIAEPADLKSWLNVAKEVEHLFGPMSNEISFHKALEKTIKEKRAFCIKAGETLCGGIMISTKSNKIAWLVVAEEYRNKGMGKALMNHALNHLDKNKDIFVNTFEDYIEEGEKAHNFYKSFGFIVCSKGKTTPAGILTINMKKEADHS